MSVSVLDADRPVGYWQLIRQNRRFRTLWTAQLISTAGDWFNSVAVLGLVLELTRNGLGASFVLLSSTVPMFFLIPIAGPVADRFDRRTLMIAANLFSAVVALLFLVVKTEDTVWLLYVATILLAVSASFFSPASAASIPSVVTRSELFAANALGGSGWGIMLLVGAALGGLVSTLFGRDVAFVINALSFVVAAGLLASIQIPSPKAISQKVTPVKDFVEGLRYLREYLPALALVAIELGWGIGAGVIVLLSVLGTEVFHRGDAGIGILYAGRGLGVLIGPFVVPIIAGNDVGKLRNAIWVSFLFAGAGYLIVAFAGWHDAIWLAFLGMMLAHFGGGIVWAVGSILLQITTPNRLRGRVSSVNNGFSTLGQGISTLAFGLALDAGTSPMTLAVVGAVLFAAFGIFWGLITMRGPFQISETTIIDAYEDVTPEPPVIEGSPY